MLESRKYAEKRREESKIGTEKIKNAGIQDDFRMLRTYRFACTSMTVSLMTAIFFLEVAVHGKLLINLDSITLTSQVMRERHFYTF